MLAKYLLLCAVFILSLAATAEASPATSWLRPEQAYTTPFRFRCTSVLVRSGARVCSQSLRSPSRTITGGAGPGGRYLFVQRWRRLDFSNVSYTVGNDRVIASFRFPSLAALRAFRLVWISGGAPQVETNPTRLVSSYSEWPVRAAQGTVRIEQLTAQSSLRFDVAGVDPAAPVTLILEITLPSRPLRLLAGGFDPNDNWYGGGSTNAMAQLDPSAGQCANAGPSSPCPDAFVAKFNPRGALQYAVYLMGRVGMAAAVSASGSLWISGVRGSNRGFVLGRVQPGTPVIETVSDRIPLASSIAADAGDNLWLTVRGDVLRRDASLYGGFSVTPDAPFKDDCGGDCDGLMQVDSFGQVRFATFLPARYTTVRVTPRGRVVVFGTDVELGSTRETAYIVEPSAAPEATTASPRPAL